MSHGTFGTAINCMDGRVQLPVIAWMKATYQLDYVDMITEPGPDKVLAEGSAAQLAALCAKVEISVKKHGSRVIAVAGHSDCAGNPVGKEEHCQHIARALEGVRSWGYDVQVVGLWIGEDWQVQVLTC